ncbi:disease resistance rpp13-like protein 2-like, partial [Trifolium pratense]
REIIIQNRNKTNHGRYLGTHLDRQIAYHFDDHGLDANSTQAFSKKGIPMSVLFFDKREGSKPGEYIGKILSTGIASEKFLETRVIDLECIFRPQLPKTLRKLNNLKYLSLRWTYLEELPPCICKLLELETLDLKHTCINYIPSSIWEMKKLQKLYLPQNYRIKLEGKPRGNFNENLHTLWGLFLYGSYPLLGYLHKLKNLQKLKLAFQLKGPEQKTLAEKIGKLEQLHSLTLKSVDETDDPMPELQKLLKLKSLCFYADSFTEIKMGCTSGGFQQLQVLRFWNLDKLKEWTVDEGAMPSLMEFEVRSCINLAFPTGLKHLKTIRMIKLRKMPNQFRKDIQLLVNNEMSLVNIEIYEELKTKDTNSGSQPSISN